MPVIIIRMIEQPFLHKLRSKLFCSLAPSDRQTAWNEIAHNNWLLKIEFFEKKGRILEIAWKRFCENLAGLENPKSSRKNGFLAILSSPELPKKALQRIFLAPERCAQSSTLMCFLNFWTGSRGSPVILQSVTVNLQVGCHFWQIFFHKMGLKSCALAF